MIDNGSTLTSSSVQIAQQSSSIGTATVTGAGSTWTINNTTVGSSGLGQLNIRDGAVVSMSFGSMTLGQNSGSSGTLDVRNSGSVLQGSGSLSVGGSGTGFLRVSDNAIINMPNGSISVGSQNFPLGRVELNNALIRVSNLTNYALVTGFGELSILATSPSMNRGRIEANGGRLFISGGTSQSLQNSGIISADAAELEFVRSVNNISEGQNTGQVTVRDGTLRFPLSSQQSYGLVNNATFAALGGESDVFGRINNDFTGVIAATNHSVVTFHNNVDSTGTISVFPGSTGIFLQNLTFSQGGLLLADLAGTNDHSGFGRVEVVGNTQLGGGSLQVTLSDGFTPKAGDSFPLVASSGAIQGTMTLSDMPLLPSGLAWDLNVGTHLVSLNVVSAFIGDYNGNSVVDAADYTVWRDTCGQTGAGLAADGNHDGVVNDVDLNLWKVNFGTVAPNGAGANSTSIPEPGGCVFAMLGVLSLMGISRWPTNFTSR